MYRYLFVVLLLTLLSACASSGNETGVASATSEPTSLVGEYRIGIGDMVRVSVWGNEDLTVTVPVRPDGMISMPLIGDVQAGGLTPEEVATEIETQLSRDIRDPRVVVILTQLNSTGYLTRIRVTGAVEQPISISHRQGMTVVDAILEAGGLNDFAAPDKSKLFRKQNGETIVYEVRLDQILNRGVLTTNHVLQPGDIVSVPERRF